jgi:alkylhydroperoxidase/carboxymuconolactone decarboxylase family protein YurZ
MSVLPVSVRLALWATAAYAGRLPLEEVVDRVHPDVDHVTGDLNRLSVWRDLGERAVLVALPRPGNLTGMPRGSAELIAAATDAGECVYVPGVGGALVPTIEHFGPAGDQGTQVTWTAYDSDPVPAHALEALALNEIERGLRRELTDRTRAIEALDATPWAGSPFRAMADERSISQWGLPEGLPRRATKIITMAALVGVATELGLSVQVQSQVLNGAVGEQRRMLLTDLDAMADNAMAAAATVAALSMAGLLPVRGDP